MIPYTKHSIEHSDIAAVVNALTSESLTSGNQVVAFEREFAEAVGATYAVACNSGTSALYLAYYALGKVGGLTRLLVPDVTFTATAATWVLNSQQDRTLHIGDVNESGQLYRRSVEASFRYGIGDVTVVHLNGDPVDLKQFDGLAQNIIVDAAHALGADGVGCEPGALMTCFSLHPAKHVACGEGGMVVTDSEEAYTHLRRMRSHGVERKDPWHYDVVDFGLNLRMPEMSAALGRSQLERLKDNVARRREIAARYSEAFDAAGVTYLKQSEKSSYHLFPIFVDPAWRLDMIRLMHADGVGSQINYARLSGMTAYGPPLMGRVSTYPDRCLSIPMFHSLRDSEVAHVIETVKRYWR